MSSAVLLLLLSATELEKAKTAYQLGRFSEVIPAIDRALEGALEPADRVLAFELKAKTQVAFSDFGGAVNTFRQLLELDPDYDLAPTEAPKLRSVLDHARQLQREREKPAPKVPPAPVLTPQAQPPPPEPAAAAGVAEPAPASTPLYQRWWVWAAVGVVVAGSATAVAVAVAPHAPRANLGALELK
ncbi:MAG: hypothetical protein IPJ65_41130 [Archangiaceae bacterium]|nr:hypothetical protein [Archangiaceae bacterium]